MKAKCKECGHKFEFAEKNVRIAEDKVNEREVIRWYICCTKCNSEINLAEVRR